MKFSFFKTRRFRVGISILIAMTSVFLLTGQYKRLPMNKEKILTVGVFSDNYWDVQNGYAYKILDDAIAKFEEKHPDIKVKYVSGIMKADYSEWLSEQMMNDAMPDVFFILGNDFSTFARIGALKELDDLILEDTGFETDMFYEAAYRAGNYGGSQYER